MLPSSQPVGAGDECLLLVHIRKVVGRVTYRACDECAEGVIIDVVLDEPFRDCGLGTRALSHLRSQHPDVTWRTTLDKRLTRDLLRRMSIPKAGGGGNCSHARSAVVVPAGT
ncbi:N-acetyltransferase [Streptomyces sp. B21-083]|uniref:N-acetyltransferase n=1 Tax=Streptomyces sp. B21-083 TaxID=3039410 RepID=UPI002FF06CA5